MSISGRPCLAAAVAATICGVYLLLAPTLQAQGMDDSIVSKHVRIRIPSQRLWLGRAAIADLENAWGFVERAAAGRLPKRVLVVIEWEDSAATVDEAHGTISIGMNNPAAVADMKGFLLHGATREMARLALTALSGGRASSEENRFLLEGMAEMMAHEFSGTVRRLGAAWAICYYLDRITPLDLRQLPGRMGLSLSSHDLRGAAPGITFLTTCRELYGQERVFKLFEGLARRNLEESLASAFKSPAAELEAAWLKRVRSYNPNDVTIAGQEEAPALDRINFVPDQARPGSMLAMRLFTRDGANDLSPAGIFAVDESSAKVFQGRQAGNAESLYTQIEIPIESARQDGRYRLRVVAVDEGGNVRNWEAFYSVAR